MLHVKPAGAVSLRDGPIHLFFILLFVLIGLALAPCSGLRTFSKDSPRSDNTLAALTYAVHGLHRLVINEVSVWSMLTLVDHLLEFQHLLAVIALFFRLKVVHYKLLAGDRVPTTRPG